MSAPRPFESELLDQAERVVHNFAAKPGMESLEARLQLLEAAAARLGGFRLEAFNAQFEIHPLVSPGQLIDEAKVLIEAIEQSRIHPAFALSALAREELDDSSRRTTGAYHTDFRLAMRLAQLALKKP